MMQKGDVMEDNFWNRYEWVPLLLGPVIGIAILVAGISAAGAVLWHSIRWLINKFK